MSAREPRSDGTPPTGSLTGGRQPSERLIVFLIGAVQLFNILDFVIVMPIGPDTARSLGFSETRLGWISFSYAAAAALSGLVGARLLDRFDRRPALLVALLGLVVGTAAGGAAVGLYSLMAARLLAGLFGGPATSLALAIISDVVPSERRGRAVGALAGAFAAATVLGVPLGLWIGLRAGWRATYLFVALLGLVIAVVTYRVLPSLVGHRALAQSTFGVRDLLRLPDVRLSYLMTALTMGAGFLVIPNIPAYVQRNLHYPREKLGLLYSSGGLASLVVTRLAGLLVDRWGSFRTSCLGVGLLLIVYQNFFLDWHDQVPLPLVYVGFMTAMGLRNVAYNTLTTKVPAPELRARFASLQSTVQHLAAGLGALVASFLLTTSPTGALLHLERAALASMALGLLVPPVIWLVEKRLIARGGVGVGGA